MRKAIFVVSFEAGENTDEELQHRLEHAVETHFKSRKPLIQQIDDAVDWEIIEDDKNNTVRRIHTYTTIGTSEEGKSHQ